MKFLNAVSGKFFKNETDFCRGEERFTLWKDLPDAALTAYLHSFMMAEYSKQRVFRRQ
jgi:hypothetical protein